MPNEKVSFSRTTATTIIPQGGLNTANSVLTLPPGAMVECFNFELANQHGWRRPEGHERYDGGPLPSRAEPLGFLADHLHDVEAGEMVDSDSGAICALLLDYRVDTPELWLYVVSGTVSTGDVISHNSSAFCTITGEATAGSIDDFLEMKGHAVEIARSMITEIPGAGTPLGVWNYKGDVYAFRNDADPATKKVMFKSSPTGWQEILFPFQLRFDTGTAPDIDQIPIVGDTVTNGTATADIIGIQKLNSAGDGSWVVDVAIPDRAVGILHLGNITGGTFADTDTLTFTTNEGAGSATAVATAGQVQIVLAPDGRYEFENYNFIGGADGLRMYGVDGVNPGFEFDGTDLIQFFTGLDDDTPEHIFIANYQAFVSKVGSWMISPIGSVHDMWEGIRGSAEWGMGDKIVGAVVTPGGTAISFARNSISIIYPTATGYAIKPYSSDYGAMEWSMQNAVAPVFLSDAGLTMLTTTDRFGDFNLDTMDEPVKDTLAALKKHFITSCVFRNKGEYRMYFENGYCMRYHFDKTEGRNGFTIDSYPQTVRGCTASVRSDRYLSDKDIVEEDHVYFYTDVDGYIRRMDSGDSFDGEDIIAYFELPWNHLGAVRTKKRWFDVILEVEADSSGTPQIGVMPIYKMFDPHRTQVEDRKINLDLPEGRWSEVNWSEFYYSGSAEDGLYKVRLRGVTPGLGLVIASRGGGPFTVKSITARYAPRGEVR